MNSLRIPAAQAREPHIKPGWAFALTRIARVIAVLVASLPWSGAQAHEFRILAVRGEFRPGGEFVVELRVDIDALVLGQRPGSVTIEQEREIAGWSPSDWMPRIADLERYFSRRVRLRFDGVVVEPRYEFPDVLETAAHGELRSGAGPTADVLGRWKDFVSILRSANGGGSEAATTRPSIRANHTVRLTGRVPDGATQFTFWASRSFGPAQLLLRGPVSDVAVMTATSAGVASATYRLNIAPEQPGAASIAWRYLVLGFEHIVPLGVDHILFVLALFLLSERLRPLLWQVTAFTVAHSLTLGLAMLNVVSLSPGIVEPLIAFSIALVAAENLFTKKLRPWRPAVVFLFGLLHGLGFAGVLNELGMPEGGFAIALASFNVGVELGQLAVVGVAALCVMRWKARPWYQPRVTMPASAAISAMGLFWTVSRIWF